MDFFKNVFEPKAKETKKKTAASKSKKGTKGKENKAKSKGRGRAKAAPKASKAAAPEPLTAKAATKIVNDLIAKETKALKSICNKKATTLNKVMKSKKPKILIADSIPKISLTCHAVELPSCSIVKTYALRSTFSAQQMLKLSDPDYRSTATLPMSGPLGFLYSTVFTVILKSSEEENFSTVKVHFYDSWATQMSTLLTKYSTLKLSIPNICVLAKSHFEEDSADPLSICIGPTVFDDGNFDDSVTCDVVVYPDSGRGTQARSVEATITSENCGTISKPVDMLPAEPFGKREREVWTDNTSKKVKKNSDEKYTQLKGLEGIVKDKKIPDKEKIVSVYASILSSTPPRRTARGEWMTSLTLLDSSLKTAGAAVTLNVFNPDPMKLPNAWGMGDVLRCHRVLVQSWIKEGEKKGEVQLLSTKGTSFVVVSRVGEEGAKESMDMIKKEKNALDPKFWNVRSTATKAFNFTLEDATMVRKCWSDMAKFVQGKGTVMEKSKAFSIEKMNDDFNKKDTVIDPSTVNGDLTCLVTAVIPNPTDQADRNAPFGFLRVWDGTGNSVSDPLPVDTPHAADAVAKGDPSVDSMIAIHDASSSRGMKGPPSLCGRVVNVAVWEAPHWEYIVNGWMGGPKVTAGTWVRLRNIWDSTMGEARMLMLGDRAGLIQLPEWCYEIGEVLTRHSKDIKKKKPFNPQCTVYDPGASTKKKKAPAKKGSGKKKSSPPSSDLSCLAECLGEPAPSTFKIRATIVATNPSPSPITSLLSNPEGLGAKKGEVEWQFAVHLTDNTAEIPAILAGDHAEVILGDANLLSQKGAKGTKAVKAAEKAVKDLTDENKVWEMQVGSFEIDGTKYFKVEAVELWEMVE
ncbi:hypothetical protein TrST_g12760 [Triparma strigata]|uniref:Telomeric single stranded DNA binding POT1/Cdc13 domain-containing protein n=1 Tax=Triparma strigata TaxID=1606541 RepID=A0A9W7E0V3_9STRA|nr:hypothetical protein TrST_g12760 [Triparma strigata]